MAEDRGMYVAKVESGDGSEPEQQRPVGKIRRGHSEWMAPDEFSHLDLFKAGREAFLRMHRSLNAGHPYQQSLHPDRISSISGVVDHDGDPVPAWGEKLLTNTAVGADMLVLPPHARFPVHIHPGHHLLLVVAGTPTFSLDGVVHDTPEGTLMMVEGGIPHAVGAGTSGAVIVAFGSPHSELDSEHRMTVVEWGDGLEVLAPEGYVP